MQPRRIYLIGFMGAGKSSVGRRLARRLKWEFIDLDKEIERLEGRPVPSIFRDDGEKHFRDLERQYLKEVATRPNTVIALGGGAFADPQNQSVAASSGLTVWLKVSFAKAAARVKMDGTRPMFANKEQAEKLLQSREPHYALAKVHVSTDERTVDAVADEILGVVRSL